MNKYKFMLKTLSIYFKFLYKNKTEQTKKQIRIAERKECEISYKYINLK